MKPKKSKQQKKDAPLWMVTYADMVTLILVFFILLFSMSQIDAVKFKAVAESYQERVIFDFSPSAIPLENPTNEEVDIGDDEDLKLLDMEEEEENPDQEDAKDQSEGDQDLDEAEEEGNLEELLSEVEQFLSSEGLAEVISANRTERGVVLILQERVLFESGEAELIEEGEPFLNKVGTLLNNIPNHVKIEGHTDSRPISNYRFPSNWELSGARASSVVRFFTDDLSLDPSRFQAVGFADTRPVAENDGSDNWQRNRRVEIVILEAQNN
ncbi:flagellar motor protein MotS [Halalkalibacillus sediminis]|uniref:Flagellar motor protein MotS n=1 Tax=Halalkalibacillus sediminis TaxID=2018042 RepID=A0A2I0QYA3_9BACI|nr:flagellar motor protein MotS [Halalkalibacillus sediminis]PKR79307.1 flagellar motor protein MotS [Halalkalibacillus sediminis]